MRRREFFTLVGGAAATWPLAARAQQPAMPIVGFLSGQSYNESVDMMDAFRRGLGETGYIAGRDLTIEYRFADGRYDRMPALMADLIRRKAAVIAATGTASALAAKAATSTIPIVFGVGGDPVILGLVPSLNRPNGNLTGISFLSNTMMAKQLGLLHELAPKEAPIGFLVNPANPNAGSDTADLQAAAPVLGHKLLVMRASTDSEIETAFAAFVQQRIGALLIEVDPFLTIRRVQLAVLTARHALPAIGSRAFVDAGGLMSYGSSLSDTERQIGIYTGRILKGEKPADLPVVQSTKFQFVINLKTAKTLGITIPPGILAIADEVIE